MLFGERKRGWLEDFKGGIVVTACEKMRGKYGMKGKLMKLF